MLSFVVQTPLNLSYYLKTLEPSSVQEIVKKMFETTVLLFRDGI